MVLISFETLNLHKLIAGCCAINLGSEKAFKKAGFVEEGRPKEHYAYSGKFVDEVRMGIINKNWKNNKL